MRRLFLGQLAIFDGLYRGELCNVWSNDNLTYLGVYSWNGEAWEATQIDGDYTDDGTGNATSIQGVAVDATAPTSGYVLGYNGSQWAPTPNTTVITDEINVKDSTYGAIGDGSSHQLSSRYASLAAAQVMYPFATSLTQQVDWCAAYKAYLATLGSQGGFNRVALKKIRFPAGEYMFDANLFLSDACGLILQGSGGRYATQIRNIGTNDGTPVIQFDGLNCGARDFTIRNSATGGTGNKIGVLFKNITGGSWITSEGLLQDVVFAGYGSGRFETCVAMDARIGSGSGSTSNNEFHKFIRVVIENGTATGGYGFKVYGSQAHGIKYEDCEWADVVYGIYDEYGCFTYVDGGTSGGSVTGADFYFKDFHTLAHIQNFNSEGANRLAIISTFSGAGFPVIFQNIRCEHSGILATDGWSIMCNNDGPLTFVGNEISDTVRNPYMLLNSGNSDQAAIIQGNVITGATSYFSRQTQSLNSSKYELGFVQWRSGSRPEIAGFDTNRHYNRETSSYERIRFPREFKIGGRGFGQSTASNGAGWEPFDNGDSTKTIDFRDLEGAESDANYHVECSISNISGAPPSAPYAYASALTANGFTLNLSPAASAYTCDVSWAVTKKKAQPTAPTSIATVYAWWKAADLGTAGLINGDPVGTWTDAVSSLVLSQGTAGNKPTYVAKSSNGRYNPSVSFDGSNDYLASTLGASSWKGLHDGSGWTMLVCYRVDPALAAFAGVMGTTTGAASAAGRNIKVQSPNVYGETWSGAAGIGSSGGASPAIGATVWYGTHCDTSNIYETGSRRPYASTALTGAVGSGNPQTTLGVGNNNGTGGGNPFFGEIFEIVIIQSALTRRQYWQFGQYWEWKYGARQ